MGIGGFPLWLKQPEHVANYRYFLMPNVGMHETLHVFPIRFYYPLILTPT